MDLGWLIPGTNKVFAVRLVRPNVGLFYFQCKWNTKCDHAGPGIQLHLFSLFDFDLEIHDRRHWNEDLDCWHTEETSQEEYKKNCTEDIAYYEEQIADHQEKLAERKKGIGEGCYDRKACKEGQ